VRSIDANIVLRWLTGDNPHQAAVAASVLAKPVFVPLTALVEIAWVLQSSYRYDRVALNEALTVLLDLATVTVSDEPGVRWALGRHAAGADFPDMLHLVASRGAASFATFERQLAQRAGADTPLPVETLA
jgi:predicted nucleic-acid-binding protein